MATRAIGGQPIKASCVGIVDVAGGGAEGGAGGGGGGGGFAASDGDAFPDRPYKAVYDRGSAPDTTHILEVSADEGGLFSGYAACGAAPDGWVWSPSGAVTCRACLTAADEGGARRGKGRRA